MSKFEEFLPELTYMPMFRDIKEDEIIALLDAMNPELVHIKVGEEKTKENGPDIENNIFCICLRGKPVSELSEAMEVYANNGPGEPGMMMAEIPVLSQMRKRKGPPPEQKKPMNRPLHKPIPYDQYLLRFTPEMLSKFYGAEVAPAQGKMLVNFLGLLAQKVTNVRKEKRAVQEQLDALLPNKE